MASTGVPVTMGSSDKGRYAAAVTNVCMPPNPFGTTPMMVKGCPSSVTVRPTTAGSPLNHYCQPVEVEDVGEDVAEGTAAPRAHLLVLVPRESLLQRTVVFTAN